MSYGFTNHILYKPCITMLPRHLHKSHSVQALHYHVTKTASQITSCTRHAVLCYQYSFTNHILYKPCSTVLPRQLHKSHSVQAMQYHVTNTASQITFCTSHTVPCYQDSFTNHILYKPCSTVLPIQLHKPHPVQALHYHVTKTASQITSCTRHVVPCYQYSLTNHILYKPCSTVLPIQLHKSHPVQAKQYHVTHTASQITSCTSLALPCYQDSFNKLTHKETYDNCHPT